MTLSTRFLSAFALIAFPLFPPAWASQTYDSYYVIIQAPDYSFIQLWSDGSNPAYDGITVFSVALDQYCVSDSQPMPLAINGGNPSGLTVTGTLDGSFTCFGAEGVSQIAINMLLDPQVLYRAVTHNVLVKGGRNNSPVTNGTSWSAQDLTASGTLCLDSECVTLDGWNGIYEAHHSVAP
jgi:hypothetical protein